MNYRGIDLHSSNSVVTATNDEDRIMMDTRLPNDLAKILAFLALARNAGWRYRRIDLQLVVAGLRAVAMASLAVEKHVSIMAALDVMVKFLTSVQMKLLILRPTSVEEGLPNGSSRMQKVNFFTFLRATTA